MTDEDVKLYVQNVSIIMLLLTGLTLVRSGPSSQVANSAPQSRRAGLETKAISPQYRQSVTLQTQTQILEYQNHITTLKRRVRALENALQGAHAKLSDDTHPLLRFGVDVDSDQSHAWKKEDYLNMDGGEDETQGQVLGSQDSNEAQDQPKDEEADNNIVKAFGSLSIKEDGRSTYHAQNAGAWNDEDIVPDVPSDATHSTDINESQDGIPTSTPDEATEPISLSSILTPDILYASRMFPMGAIDDANISSEILLRIESYLPVREEAVRLVDNYYAKSSWLYDPVSRSHFMSAIFDTIYPLHSIENPPQQIGSWSSTQPQSPPYYDPDLSALRPDTYLKRPPLSYSLTLAMFYIVLAIGTHLDLDQQCGSPCTNIYYHLARAAVASDWAGNIKSVPKPGNGSTIRMGGNIHSGTGMSACLLEPGLDIIRILLLMCFYLHMSDGRMGYSASWALMGLVTKLASGIGLHRDPSKWSLDPVESRLRQEVFWELYTYDSWQERNFRSSIPSGRPPSFLRMGIDLERPYEQLLKKFRHRSRAEDGQDENSFTLDKENVLNIFKAWKHHFCFMKLGPTVEQAWGALLDRVLRKNLENTPVLLKLPPESEILPASKTSEMSGVFETCQREPHQQPSLFPQFSQLRTQPNVSSSSNPKIISGEESQLQSSISLNLDLPTTTSLTMQRYTLLFMTHIGVPALFTRISTPTAPAQVFSSVTCLGGLVVRSPNLSFASSALVHIEVACDLFKRVKDSNRATRTLPTMIKLRDKARLVLKAHQTQPAQRSQDLNNDNGKRTASSDPNTQEQSKGPGFADIPVPLDEEEKNELLALVGQTRLVDLRTNGPGTKSYPHSSSNIQSTPSRHYHDPYSSPMSGSHSTALPRLPASHIAFSSVPASEPLSTPPSINVSVSSPRPTPIPADTFVSMSTDPEYAPGNGVIGVPVGAAEFDIEFRGQPMMSFGDIDQSQSPFEAQFVDPFLLFRQLGLDLTPPNTSDGDNMKMSLYADTDSPGALLKDRIEPYWQLGYDPTQFQADVLPGNAFLDTEALQAQQTDFTASMNIDIIQHQDTDTAFENFIAQAMKEYTSKPEFGSASGTLDSNIYVNSSFGISQGPNANLPNDSLGSKSWNPTFGMSEAGLQNIPILNEGQLHFQRNEQSESPYLWSTGEQIPSTHPSQSPFATSIPIPTESSSDGVGNDTITVGNIIEFVSLNRETRIRPRGPQEFFELCEYNANSVNFFCDVEAPGLGSAFLMCQNIAIRDYVKK
ncbi:hypothetical protein Clacol_005401 [Clathrus columnatus]|uniref:Xylanolytic transcriptional activator regulatory domain-containing protein n=1 Tax=Clathrus columnatus TaxID=1419009 RepID=A0AAV5AEM7_9AGAM|nr:hypothetical protein Clacol_005401 [Clathrus columnatus]